MRLAERTISNHFPDFRLLNVAATTHHPERRGPYMVTQTGSAPGDPTQRECTFALTRKGTWMHCFLFFMLPRDLRRSVAVFEDMTAVTQLCDSLPSKPVVETVDSLQELLHEAGFQPLAEDPVSQALMEELQSRRA